MHCKTHMRGMQSLSASHPCQRTTPLVRKQSQISTKTQIGSLFGGITANKRKNELLMDILSVVENSERGTLTTQQDMKLLRGFFSELGDIAASDPLQNPSALNGTWKLLWTSEKEILFIIKKNGLANWCGTESGNVYQVIDLNENRLQNCIEFPPEGAFIVDSFIEYDSESKRCSFEFQGARLRVPNNREFNLPPVGKSTFKTLFVDSKYRIAEDARGDFLIVERVGHPRVF